MRRCLQILSQLQSDPLPGVSGVEYLYAQHTVALLSALLDESEQDFVGGEWSPLSAEHLLLCRLVEAPGSVLQKNPDISFSRLVQFLCNTLAGDRVSGTVGSDLENTKLLAFAELLHSALAPVIYRSFPLLSPHILKGVLSIEAQERRRWSFISPSEGLLDQIMMNQQGLSPQDATAAIRVLHERPLQSFVLEEFVLDGRWSRTPALQSVRLELLSALTASVCPKFSKWHALQPFQLPIVALEEIDLFEAIAAAVGGCAVIPSNPLALRLGYVYFTQQLLQHLALKLGGGGSVGDGDEVRRLKNYRRQRLQASKGTRDAIDGGEVNLQRRASSVMRYLLSLLSDSSDEVRMNAVEAIAVASPLLSCEEDRAGGVQAEDRDSVYVSWEKVVQRLLRELRVGVMASGGDGSEEDESAQLLQQMESLLRLLAVINPAGFETIVRAELANHSNIVASRGSEKVESGASALSSKFVSVMSDLISHADLLTSLDH